MRQWVGEIDPSSPRQFHQRFFRSNVILAAFFTYIRTYIRRKKAAEMTFVRKKRTENVDEIDTPCSVLQEKDYNQMHKSLALKREWGEGRGKKKTHYNM